MKRLLLLFLMVPAIGKAQNKPYLEIGGVGGYYTKSETFAYGANIGFNGKINRLLTLGVGFMPLWTKDVKKPQLPVYADVRIQLDSRTAVLLQPGYNFYKTSTDVSAPNISGKSETKGGFYGAAGFMYDFPVSPNTALYLQAKYNYFGFQNKASLRINNNPTTNTANSHTEAISLGVGLRLQ